MNKNAWVTALVVAIVFGGGGYYLGKQSAASATPTSGSGTFAGRTGGAGRFGGGAGGGFTAGTIIATGNGSITIQMAASTSTTATTGTKIVLYDTNTQIAKTTAGSMSDLTTGQNVIVTGTTNSDGSVTATMIQLRPAGSGVRGGAPAATTPTTGQ